MDNLPILKKNAYLDILIKDNCIFANLAYTDLSENKTYILSEKTDLTPLKFRLDDIVFTKSFWLEYFNSLEEVFDWDIVDRLWKDIFKLKEFESEGVGVSGIRVVVDDNQPFFRNIYLSLKEFSKDISLRMLDDRYMEVLLNSLLEELGYSDILWVDLDISHFSIYRGMKEQVAGSIFGKGKEESFTSAKIDWKNEIGVIDFVKSSKLQAFLSVDSSSDEISDRWGNFIAHNHKYIADTVIEDVLRAFTTLQLLSIKEANDDKLKAFGRGNCALFLSGNISTLLDQRDLLLSLIDGLEIEGIVDIFTDEYNKVLTFGKSLLQKEEAPNIVVFKRDVIPTVSKLLVPEIPQKGHNKAIFSASLQSQEFEKKEVYGISPNLQIISLPTNFEKVVVQGKLLNGAVFSHLTSNEIEFLSSKSKFLYKDIIVDARERPIVYGPSVYKNRIKMKSWGDGNKK